MVYLGPCMGYYDFNIMLFPSARIYKEKGEEFELIENAIC